MDDLQQSRAAVLGELQKAVISPTFDEAKVASFFSPDVRYELRPASATVAMPGFPKDGFVPADKVPKWYKLVHDKFSQENNGMDMHHLVHSGDDLVAHLTSHALASDGKDAYFEVVLFITFEPGKTTIKWFSEFVDSVYAVELIKRVGLEYTI